MKIIDSRPPESVMALGKFECIHLGHKALIEKASRRARVIGLPMVVMSFLPHPKKVLGDVCYKPLLTPAEVAEILRKTCEVDYFLQFPFTKAIAQMTHFDFCKILFCELGAKEVFVGEDYRFGIGRSGTVKDLEMIAREYGAAVSVVPFVKNGGTAISTSRIRSMIEKGMFKEAAELAGFQISKSVLDDACS